MTPQAPDTSHSTPTHVWHQSRHITPQTPETSHSTPTHAWPQSQYITPWAPDTRHSTPTHVWHQSQYITPQAQNTSIVAPQATSTRHLDYSHLTSVAAAHLSAHYTCHTAPTQRPDTCHVTNRRHLTQVLLHCRHQTCARSVPVAKQAHYSSHIAPTHA